MKKSVITSIGLGIAVLLSAGCQSMTYQVNPAKGTALGKPALPSVASVHETQKAHYLFWGLAPVSTPNLNEIAAGAAGPNKVMADIKIKEDNTFVDGLLAAITYGIYRPRTVEITGQVFEKRGQIYAK